MPSKGLTLVITSGSAGAGSSGCGSGVGSGSLGTSGTYSGSLGVFGTSGVSTGSLLGVSDGVSDTFPLSPAFSFPSDTLLSVFPPSATIVSVSYTHLTLPTT